MRFDHFLTFTSARTVEAQLARYEALGFTPDSGTVRHDPGLRNGFVQLGPEYLELLWVEDESLFAAAPAEARELRTPPRPFGIGIAAADVTAMHDAWISRGFNIPNVFSKGERDASADAPPVWTFVEIPRQLLPGAETFLIQYHRKRRESATNVRPAANSIYGIAGVTLVTADPQSRATRWRDLLAPEASVDSSEVGFAVDIGPHRATWMAPDAYREFYDKAWQPATHDRGEIALLHLLAEDLATVRARMRAGGRIASDLTDGLLIEPDPVDGFAFAVSQLPVDEWIQRRTARTGETLTSYTSNPSPNSGDKLNR